MFHLYILRSLFTARYYIGHTENLERRLKEHNDGRCRSTKAYKPWKLVYMEEHASKSEAFRRERVVKNYKSEIKFKELQKSERWQSG